MSRLHVLPHREPHAVETLLQAAAHLTGADPRLAEVIQRIGPCGLRRQAGGVPRLFRSILGRQRSPKAAAALHARIVAPRGPAAPAARVLAWPAPALAPARVVQ